MLGLWGTAVGPPRLIDADATVLLAFIEGVICEADSEAAEHLHRMYSKAANRRKPAAERSADRLAELEAFAALTGGHIA